MKKKIISGLCILSLSTLTSNASLTLLTSGNESLQTKLFEQINGGVFDRVREVLAARASLQDSNGSDSAPLHYAVFFNHLAAARFLLKTGACVNTRDGAIPLHDAVDQGNTGMVKLILAYKANVNLKDEHGHSPLYNDRAKNQNYPDRGSRLL